MLLLACICLILASAVVHGSSRPVESYSESLLLRRLDEDSIGFRFEFVHRKLSSPTTTTTNGSAQQYETFPKLVAQMIPENVTELRLILTRGKWRWENETLWPSVESASPGAEVWGKMLAPERDWPILIRSLAGLTCASLDVLQYNMVGKMESGIIFAHLPFETVCVENLAPFLKLLPCRNKAGLGALISPKQIVRESKYYSLAFTVRRNALGLEFIQSLSLVLPLKARLPQLFPRWSELKQCGSTDAFLVAENGNEGMAETWNLFKDRNASLLQLDALPIFAPRHQVNVIKWQTGTGSLYGRMSTQIQCRGDEEEDMTLSHLEFLPHFLLPRMQTLQVYSNGIEIVARQVITNFKSTDGKGSPGYISFALHCAHGDTTTLLITYEFSKVFLFYAQYPPNPNRGFDVPSSITMFNRTREGGPGNPIYVRSNTGPILVASDSVLVYLAHPDFSMPYNVITLSSSGFALFLGMLVNISLRRRGDLWRKKPSKEQQKRWWRRVWRS